jgi:hypothetical protein
MGCEVYLGSNVLIVFLVLFRLCFVFCGGSARTPSTPPFFLSFFVEKFCLSVGFQFIFSNAPVVDVGGAAGQRRRRHQQQRQRQRQLLCTSETATLPDA